MRLFWRIGVVVATGWVTYAFGASLFLSFFIALGGLVTLMRKELLETIFPLRTFRKRCLSIQGLETDPSLGEEFRRELSLAICKSFPKHRPTACCCFDGENGVCKATLILHSKRGHVPIRTIAGSQTQAAAQLISSVKAYRGSPPFRRSRHCLYTRCVNCSTRKAHRLTNRNLPQINPLGQSSKMRYFATRIRSLNP